MDIGTTVLFAVVAVLGANQALVRFPAVRGIPALFWTMQVGNLLMSVYVLFIGLPGFDHVPVVNWVVGLMVLSHVAHNMSVLQKDRRAASVSGRVAQEGALLGALNRGLEERVEADKETEAGGDA